MFTYRPEHHITPKKGWINDPNGFIFFNGRYHLYAQHNPYATEWGPMHWLHFVSDDLIHFEECGVVLKPDQPYDEEFGCFSGSAIQKDGKLYVLYTGCSHGKQTQCLAISEDGHRFRKYEGNPVISEKDLPEGYLVKDFRDPKVFFKEGKYYVLLACRHQDGYSSILLYSSLDLIHYEFVGIVRNFRQCMDDGMVECPDILFFGDKDVILYSLQKPEPDGRRFHGHHYPVGYGVGHLDLTTGRFQRDGEGLELDYGFDCYATQTLQKDGKSYLIAWEASWESKFPSAVEGYAGQLSLVKEVTLEKGKLKLSFLPKQERSRIIITPIEEISHLRFGNIEVEIVKSEKEVRIRYPGHTHTQVFHLEDVSTIELQYHSDHSCVEFRFQDGEAFASFSRYEGKEGAIETDGCLIKEA